MKRMKSSYIKSGFILSYAAIFIQSVISIAYTPVMLRLLGGSDYGLLQLAISTIANLGLLSFGFGSSYLRFYSQYKSEGNEYGIAVLNGMFTVIFALASLAALIAGAVITLNADAIFSASTSESELSVLKPLLAVMTVNLALTLPVNIFDSYIISQERFAFQKAIVIITAVLNPMLTLPVMLLGKGSVGVAVCMTLISFIKLIASMIFCLVRLGMRFRFAFDAKLFKRLFTFSFFIFLNIVSDQINWNADKTILGIVKGSVSVTAYSLGSQFNSYFLTVSYALASLCSPKAYSLAAFKRSDAELTRFFARFGRLQLCVMAYIFTVFVGVGRPFMRLWSGLQSDIPYYTALLLMSPLLVTSIQSIGIEIQRAKDMHRFRSVLYFVIATFNIAVSIPLCVRFGEIGCALGTCVCIFVGNIIIMNIYYQRRVGLDMAYFWKQILRLAPSLVPPAAAAVLAVMRARVSIGSVIAWGIVITAVYAPSVWFLGIGKDIKKTALY